MKIFMTEEEVQELLHVSRSTLYRLREMEGLPHYKIGNRAIRYEETEIENWLERQRTAENENENKNKGEMLCQQQ